MKVPFLDLKEQYQTIKKDIIKELNDVLENNSYILGEKVENLENKFAEYCGKRYGVAVNSGTSALHLALLAKDIGVGDQVITTSNTFIATVEAIIYTGATPIFVDVDGDTFNMDFTKLEQNININTKAIIPIHLYGQPAQMDRIIELAKKYNLEIIEDCCQAHGAELYEQRVPISDVGCFSFYPGKNLGAYGEGGIVVSSDKDFINRIRILRDHGSGERGEHKYVGYNYRMDGFQGAVLGVKLKKLDDWTEKRRVNARLYNQLLNGIVQTPKEIRGANSVYHIYTIKTKKEIERNKLVEYLKSKEIDVRIYYPIPIHLQEAYCYLRFKKGDLPIIEKCCREVISLPIFPELTEEQIKYVCKSIKEFYETYKE